VSSGITGKGIVEVARSTIPYLILLYAVLMVITYVPWLSLVLTQWVD
jgi:C4-dicarboxylate transporter DctM subunit